MLKRVLVVDDSRTMRLLLRGMLRARPEWEVGEAGSGAEALARAAEKAPDLVILDMYLPDTDGAALAAQIRGLPGLERVPALFLSTAIAEEECRRAAAAGPGGYLLKPLNQGDLLAAAERLLIQQ